MITLNNISDYDFLHKNNKQIIVNKQNKKEKNVFEDILKKEINNQQKRN